jgi:beta-glucanase (GH16 family)
VPIDVAEEHAYAAVWEPDSVTIFVDGRPVKHSAQSPDYPMQFMLNIYDFGDADPAVPCEPFEVVRFRSWARSEPASR